MKTSKPIIAIIVLAIVATAVAVVSCKKEQVPDTRNQSKTTLVQILDFKRQLEEIGLNPNEKTVSYMSIPDAVWNIEALFNYTYAYPGYYYEHTIYCDTTLNLPVCSNDSVSLADLYVFNGQMYEAVLTLYQAALLDDKQFIILDVEAGERNGGLQTIELHTLQGSLKGGQPDYPQMWEPFEEGHYWYYGGDMPDTIGNPIDAADALTETLNNILTRKAPEGYEYVYTNVLTKYTVLGANHPNPFPGYPGVSPRSCEFYKENPTIEDYKLYSNQMNYYYFGERHLVKNILRNDADYPVPSNHILFQIVVDDETDTIDSIIRIGHRTIAYYGYELVASQDSIHKDVL